MQGLLLDAFTDSEPTCLHLIPIQFTHLKSIQLSLVVLAPNFHFTTNLPALIWKKRHVWYLIYVYSWLLSHRWRYFRCVLLQKYKMFLLFPKHDSDKIRRLNPLTDPEKSISFQALWAENFKGVRKWKKIFLIQIVSLISAMHPLAIMNFQVSLLSR